MNKQLIGWWLAGMLVLASFQVRAQGTFAANNNPTKAPCPILDIEFVSGDSTVGVYLSLFTLPPPPIEWEAVIVGLKDCSGEFYLPFSLEGGFPSLLFWPSSTDLYFFKLDGLKPEHVVKVEIFSAIKQHNNTNPPAFNPPLTQLYADILWSHYLNLTNVLSQHGCYDVLVAGEMQRNPRIKKIGSTIAHVNNPQSHTIFPCFNSRSFSRDSVYMIRAQLNSTVAVSASPIRIHIESCGCSVPALPKSRVFENYDELTVSPNRENLGLPCNSWYNLCLSGSQNYDIKFTSDFSGSASFFKYSDPSDPSSYLLVGQGFFSPAVLINTIPLDSIGNSPLLMRIEHQGGAGNNFDATVYAR